MTIQEKIAVMQAFADGKKVQARARSGRPADWFDVDPPMWSWTTDEYRIRPSECLTPLTQNDIPPICWVRPPFSDDREFLVLGASLTAITYVTENSICSRSYEYLCTSDWQYSTDRKTWLACSKLA